MSSQRQKKLLRHQVGALPLIQSVIKRINLKQILSDHVKSHGNEIIPAAETLLLLVYNLAIGKAPLYELESWVRTIDHHALGYHSLDSKIFNDDRFARALDKLYASDRASMMTAIVKSVIQQYNLQLRQIHNDSTSVKACGAISGKTKSGLELKHGHSKDHRPDLKQLVFNLSITADGAVPIHYKSYAGNRTDDTVHIETWNTLRSTIADPNFIYVGDSKLCTDKQLSHIVEHGGRAISILPQTWKEVSTFKDSLRKAAKAKIEVLRRIKPGSIDEIEYFSIFLGDFFTEKRGYRIHWIYSSEKKQRDRYTREEKLKTAEEQLLTLNSKINSRKFKCHKNIKSAAKAIIAQYDLTGLLEVTIGETQESHQVKVGKGRAGKNAQYETRFNTIYTLTWSRNRQAIKAESRIDGIFPLLSTDKALSAKEVLQAYKYQPRLEKRFTQFKSIHNAAPLYFKKIERVEANMFIFFIALIIQSLIEREIRLNMEKGNIESLPVYPENRESKYPTANSIFSVFKDISTYQIEENTRIIEEYQDELSDTHIQLLELLEILPKEYWQPQG